MRTGIRHTWYYRFGTGTGAYRYGTGTAPREAGVYRPMSHANRINFTDTDQIRPGLAQIGSDQIRARA